MSDNSKYKKDRVFFYKYCSRDLRECISRNKTIQETRKHLVDKRNRKEKKDKY